MKKLESFLEKHKTKLAQIRESLESSLKAARYELKWYEAASESIIWFLPNDSKYRLPGNIIPRKYYVSVTPHLEIGNFIFDGNVRIEADVVQETQRIILHSAEIKQRTVKVMANETEVKIAQQANAKQYDFFIIDVSKALSVGTKLTIEISYEGHLNASELRGFYKSSYMDEEGERR